MFWTDGSDTLSTQTGTCRVNCIDCLDRTNVVQSAIARHALASAFEKLQLPATVAKQLDCDFNEREWYISAKHVWSLRLESSLGIQWGRHQLRICWHQRAEG